MNYASPHGIHDAPENSLLYEWKRLTNEGLAASRAHCVAHAMGWYLRALQVAHRILTNPEPDVMDDDRLAAYVIAHLNIADCYSVMKEPSNAAECLSCAHLKLVSLLQSPEVSASLQIAASRQLRHTYASLEQHHTKHSEHDLVEKALQAGRMHMMMPGTRLH